MKKWIAILALAFIAGCGGQARAEDAVDNLFYNSTGTTTVTRHIGGIGKVSVQVPYINYTSAYDISVSADGGAHYAAMQTYSGLKVGIYDVTTNAPTHIKVVHRQKKKAHLWPAAKATINSR